MTIYRHLLLKSPHAALHGELTLPDNPRGLVLVPQLGNHPDPAVSDGKLLERGFAVLALDLLTNQETHYPDSGQNAILLAERLIAAFDYCRFDGDTEFLRAGIYASGLTVPAAVRAAAQRDTYIAALVVRNGLIDHAGREYLEALEAPLLVIADTDHDDIAIACERAFPHLHAEHRLLRQPRESGNAVAGDWFVRWLPHPVKSAPR